MFQYWTIFKNRLKNKIRTDRAARRQTGAGPSNVVFTSLEERAINIIGSDAGAPLRGVQVDPFRSQVCFMVFLVNLFLYDNF